MWRFAPQLACLTGGTWPSAALERIPRGIAFCGFAGVDDRWLWWSWAIFGHMALVGAVAFLWKPFYKHCTCYRTIGSFLPNIFLPRSLDDYRDSVRLAEKLVQVIPTWKENHETKTESKKTQKFHEVKENKGTTKNTWKWEWENGRMNFWKE